MLNVRVKKALLTILTACLTVLMTIGAVLGFTPTTLSAKAAAGDTYTLVTSVNDLKVGDQVVIVASGFNYALSTTQQTNNRTGAEITKGDNTVTINDNVQVLTLEAGTKDGTFAFNTGSGYLYAASKSSNHLKTGSKNDNASWEITITSAGVATIKAQGANTKNWLRFNNGNSPKLFSCYSSGQADVSIYKMETGNTGNACAHEDTTVTYTYLEDDTHTVTTTCNNADCGNVKKENVDCNYGDEITVPATEEATGRIYVVCGDCKHEKTIKELPKINATKYTLSFSVPKEVPSVASVEVAEGYTCVLEAAADYNDYTFAGWAVATLENVTTTAPTLYKAGAEYTMGAADTTLYAVYSYSAGGSGNFEKVTENLSNWSGEYLIVYEAGNVAFNGGLEKLDDTKNTIALTEDLAISDNTIVGNEKSKAATFVIEQTESGYTIKSASGYYIGQTSNANGLASNNSTTYSNTISINNDGTVNLVSGGAYLRYNKASDQARFRYFKSGTYTSQQAITLYKLEAATVYYTTNLGHVHSFTETEVEATCTEAGGIRKTCDCDHTEFVPTAEALGHNYEITETIAGTCQAKEVTNYTCSRCPATKTEEGELGDHVYVDNVCSICSFVDPLSVDYSGYYYFTFNKDIKDENDNRVPATLYVKNDWDKSKDRYVAYPNQPTSELGSYLFRLVRNEDGTYNIYEGTSNNLFAEGTENVFVVKNGEYYNIYNADNIYFSLNKTFGDNYMKFYPSEQTRNITFVEYKEIVSAGLTLGEELVVNYKVAMDDKYATAEMTFTMNGVETTVTGTKEGNVYVYSLAIAPQHMGEEISAVLTFNDETLASKESYSVKAYAEYQLENSTNETLKQLVVDMLYYGKAAQEYKNYKTDELVTEFLADVTGAPTPNTAAPTTTDFELVNELAAGSTYPAYFVGAGVRFGADNKIFVELSTVENVTLKVNGVEFKPTSNTFYTEGLKATQFGDTFTFELYCDGVLMQTLTYSVNAYAHQFAGGNDAMANLAIALYNYGQSAGKYVA